MAFTSTNFFQANARYVCVLHFVQPLAPRNFNKLLLQANSDIRFAFAKQMLDKNLHYLSFNVHALLRQLVYFITSFSVCQDFFKSFLKKFLTSSQPRTLLFPCPLVLSTDDLIIIHSITPFVNTFFQLFSSFFIFLFATLYIVVFTFCNH